MPSSKGGQLERSLLVRLGVCAAIGAVGWVVPAPDGISTNGWHLVGIFVATIASFLIKPLAMGPMVLLALVALAATGTIEFKALLHGFGDQTVWLVVAAFLIAGTVERTGFGRRIALLLVKRLGRSMLGLGYAQCGAELILGPVVPSNTARGGGILAPIAQSLARSLQSEPDTETREKAGAYLTLVGAHANLITAAMFMTGIRWWPKRLEMYSASNSAGARGPSAAWCRGWSVSDFCRCGCACCLRRS